jgi:LysR family transcriptional regulator, regulator for metE and metH
MPAGVAPARHKSIETTDIMLQMVASGRGVAALPRWLVEEYAGKMEVTAVRLGPQGIPKQIFLGLRESDLEIRHLKHFVELARAVGSVGGGAPAVPVSAGAME